MNKVECKLECRHSVRISVTVNPEPGEAAYCRMDGWQEVIEVFHMENRVVCCHCTFGRWCGQSVGDARSRAKQHEYLRRGHVCIVMSDTVTAQGGTPRQKVIAQTVKDLRRDLVSTKVEPVKELPPPF